MAASSPSKILVIAPTREMARWCAQQLNVSPMSWVYVHDPLMMKGINHMHVAEAWSNRSFDMLKERGQKSWYDAIQRDLAMYKRMGKVSVHALVYMP